MDKKPRIVREWEGTADTKSPSLNECFHGKAYLALPWPEDCPYTPEQVMMACDVQMLELVSTPFRDGGLWWFACKGSGKLVRYIPLTPKFIAAGEPKKCSLPHTRFEQAVIDKCVCGAPITIVSNRRMGERRKGERRGLNYIGNRDYGGRQRGIFRRADKDRRK
jgi:hypothetical protein